MPTLTSNRINSLIRSFYITEESSVSLVRNTINAITGKLVECHEAAGKGYSVDDLREDVKFSLYAMKIPDNVDAWCKSYMSGYVSTIKDDMRNLKGECIVKLLVVEGMYIEDDGRIIRDPESSHFYRMLSTSGAVSPEMRYCVLGLLNSRPVKSIANDISVGPNRVYNVISDFYKQIEEIVKSNKSVYDWLADAPQYEYLSMTILADNVKHGRTGRLLGEKELERYRQVGVESRRCSESNDEYGMIEYSCEDDIEYMSFAFDMPVTIQYQVNESGNRIKILSIVNPENGSVAVRLAMYVWYVHNSSDETMLLRFTKKYTTSLLETPYGNDTFPEGLLSYLK